MNESVYTDPRRLAALANTGLLSSSGDDALHNLAEIASELVGAPVSFVSLVAADRQLFAGRAGWDIEGPYRTGTPLSHSFCRIVVETNEMLVVDDAATDARVQDNPAIGDLGVAAYLGVPLQLPTGEVLGSLCAIDTVARKWTLAEQRALTRLARTAVAEIRLRRKVILLTESLQARDAAEQDLQRIFTTLPLPTWVYDTATLQFLEVNTAACATYGYDRDEFLGLTVHSLRREMERQALGTNAGEHDSAMQGPNTGRVMHVRRDGSEMEVEVTSAPISFRTRAARLVIVRDVTAAKQAERELHLLRTAVSRLNDIVIITDAAELRNPGPQVVYVNEAFERRMGYAASDIIGRTPRMLQGAKTDREALTRIRHSLETRQPIREELINYTKDGQEIWLDIEIVPVVDADGVCSHFVAVERDVTERKRLEGELQQVQRLEALGQFSGGIAHDFANITAIIGASAELLRGRLGERGDCDGDLEAIHVAAERARALVGQILAFSRRQVLDMRPVSLHELVHQGETLLQRLLTEHVQLRVSLPPEEITVLADETQIMQVLLNLGANARDAMPNGGSLLLEVERIPSPAGDFGRIRISDTGCGIAPEHLSVIFEPFFTTKAAGHGTGLGLATVYGIVQQLGGELRVDSVVGRGTTFEIDLPLAVTGVASHHDVEGVAAAGQAQRRTELLQGLRVLLVEDEDALRRATQRLLQRFGVQVEAAVNGVEALQMVRDSTSPFDLVLTDMIMPGLGGRALAEALGELRPDLPVLFMSGYDAGTAHNALGGRAGAGHLQKPFDVESLLDAVAAAVAQGQPAG